MAYSCDIVTETAAFTDRATSTTASVLASATARFAVAITLVVSTTANETAQLDDHVVEANFAVVTETARIHGVAYPVLHSVNVAREQVRARSRVVDLVGDAVSETASLNETTSHVISSVIAEQAVARDSVTQTARLTTLVSDSMRVRDRIVQQAQAVLRETAALSDSVYERALLVDVASDSARILGQAFGRLNAKTVVSDSFRALGQVVHVLHAVDIASETAVILGGVVEPLRGEAWTAGTDTFAMSRYTGYRFNSAAVIGGRLYAAGDAGIYALDGATDVGAAVPASLVTGLSDFGDPSQKRVREVFVGYEATGSLAMTVASTGSGTETAYTYSMPAKTAVDPTANRIKIGRGLRSRFWRFTLTNPSGDAFTITEARVEIDDLSRKL